MDQIQVHLRKQAEILGNLNLELNKYVEANQEASLQITKLQERIAKKKKQIDQETKDKAIIQEKLIKAEELKKSLEIQASSEQVPPKDTHEPIEQQIKRPQFLSKPPKKEEPEQKANRKESKEQKMQQSETEYENTDKGGYQPPLLLTEGVGSGSDSEDNDQEDVLESVRQKLEILDKAGDDDEDD